MFRDAITTNKFAGNAADTIFGRKIPRQSYGSDNSLCATLRAIVAPRMSDNDVLRVEFRNTNYAILSEREKTADTMEVRFGSDHYGYWGGNALTIVSLNGREEGANASNLEVIEKYFVSEYSAYEALPKVTLLYAKAFKVLCFISREKKHTIMFVESLNLRKLHYLQCSIPGIMPWYFDDEHPLDDDERALIYSLRENTPDKYNECIKRIADKFDFESVRIKSMLKDFETRYERNEIDRVRESIRSYDQTIRDLNRRIGEYLGMKNDEMTRLLGLEAKLAMGGDGESEMMEYFICNKRLKLLSVIGSDMTFATRDYLTYYEKDAARRAINKRGSFVYTRRDGEARTGYDHADIKTLLKAIFLDETLKIKMCAAYSFRLNGSVNPITGYDFNSNGEGDFDEYMPNPHIDRYACMGNYTEVINELMDSRNYIAILEQCGASGKSLNWYDSTVMYEFMDNLLGENGKNSKCIELPDGRVVKAAEAIEWLKNNGGVEPNGEETETEEE